MIDLRILITPTATALLSANALGQGGDTLGQATVISTLPHSSAGTTLGFTHDYDEICPYFGSTSPDVVYSYTPAANVTIDVSLCANSAYDTKLYIYENEHTPNFPYACNDDACSTPSFPQPHVSRLDDVNLVGGNTYFIVIDGFGGDAGAYTLDVTEELVSVPDVCPILSMFSQDPTAATGAWSLGTSDAGTVQDFIRFDDYAAADDIVGLRWWGARLSFPWANCGEDPMSFEIRFYPDDGNGAPDVANPSCSYTRTLFAFDPQIQWSTFELFRFETTFDPCCELREGWVSIQAFGPPADCWFLWASSGETGAGASWLSDDGELEPIDFDLALCLVACDPVNQRLFLHGPDYDPNEPVTDPTLFDWNELFPLFERAWNVTSWQDDGSGELDESDVLSMSDGSIWRVEERSFTVAVEEDAGGPVADWIYMDFISPAATFPLGLWAEIHPELGQVWDFLEWIDDGSGLLDEGDFFTVLTPAGEEIFLHTAQTGTDIQITEQPAVNPCPADINNDSVVNVLDLLLVLGAWGLSGVPEDINNDGTVNVLDLLEVLGAWGPC